MVSVSQVADYLRLLTEGDAFLSNLLVQGDVTDVFLSRAGHLYFTLSDGLSSLKAVAFRNVAIRVQHLVTTGAALTVGGRVTVYARDQTCQIYVEFVDSTGIGGHALALARLRSQLQADGLFEYDRKRQLPAFPRTIGVVTSPQGAVIHDIQTVLRRRFPLVHLVVAAANVQGPGSVDSLIMALDTLINDGRADLIIIARGGGSAEDLSSFNDERLARAVFASPIPVMSAIGHETDFTILDEVADVRAPTPSAAAELATPDIADFAFDLIDARDRMIQTAFRIVTRNRSDLLQAAQRLDRASPSFVLAQHRSRVADAGQRLRSAVDRRLHDAMADCRVVFVQLNSAGVRVFDRQRIDLAGASPLLRELSRAGLRALRASFREDQQRLGHGSRRFLIASYAELEIQKSALAQLNPASVLNRGFALLTDTDNVVIRGVADVRAGTSIRATVRDGTIAADVTGVSAL